MKELHRLGPRAKDDKEAIVFNRVVRWTAAGLEYEADPRQAEKLLRDLKLDGEGVKSASTPGVKLTKEQVDADKALEASKTSPYRAVAARANYLASDRLDAHFEEKKHADGCRPPPNRFSMASKDFGAM